MSRSIGPTLATVAILTLVGAGCAVDLPAPAPEPTLARSTSLPPGAPCPFGGTELAVGPDRNHNGRLDDDEVEQRSNSCSDARLVRVDPEPAGANCPSGGKAVHDGLDRNHDGQLEDDEVESTTYTCDPAAVFRGDFTAAMWNDPAALAALLGADVITGNLEIAGPDAVALPRLTVVGGTLSAASQLEGSTMLELPALELVVGALDLAHEGLSGAIALPRLLRVGGSVRITQAEVTALSAPALTQVGSLFIEASRIEHLALPALVDTGFSLVLQNNPSLIDLSLPRVRQLSALVVVHNDALTSLAGLDNVFDAASVTIADNAALAAPGLPVLSGITNLTISGPATTTIGFPRLVFARTVRIHDVPALEQLTLPSLDSAQRIDVVSAPRLARLDLPLLVTLAGQHLGPDRIIAIAVSGTAIDMLSLPALIRSSGQIAVNGNANLATIDLPQLQLLDRIVIDSAPRLTTISAPALITATALDLQSSPIATLALGKLTSIIADLRISGTALTAVDGLGALQTIGGALTLSGDTQLASLAGFAKLSSVRGAVTIDSCPALSADEIAALIARVHP